MGMLLYLPMNRQSPDSSELSSRLPASTPAGMGVANVEPQTQAGVAASPASAEVYASVNAVAKRGSKYNDLILARHQWTSKEKKQDWGQLLSIWLASGDSANAMKALTMLMVCSDAQKFSNGLYATNHMVASDESRKELERNQARLRRCQSVPPMEIEQSKELIERALRGGEPGAAMFAITFFGAKNLPMPTTVSELVRSGLERDFIAGQLQSLQVLAFSAAQMGATAIDSLSYEIAWRIVKNQSIGNSVSPDEFSAWLADVNSSSSAASSERVQKEFEDLILRSGRPALSAADLAIAQARAGKLVEAMLLHSRP
jgi:hypothetical protein